MSPVPNPTAETPNGTIPMKKLRPALTTPLLAAPLAAVALLAAALPAGAAPYAVDASHTSVVFSISHLGYSYTYGMFRKTGGAFEFDPNNPAACRFDLTLDVTSLDTMDAKRDEHLRSPDFFNANQFPQITFRSESVAKTTSADGKPQFDVTGTLTMHGVAQRVTLPMIYLGGGKGPYGKDRVGFLCQTSVKRTDFGMTNMVPMIGDAVGVTISFEGILQ